MLNKKRRASHLNSHKPLLDSIYITIDEGINKTEYPFCLPLIQHTKQIIFEQHVTFFVGENGSGKSTLLEGLAHAIGFGPEGGSKNINFKTSNTEDFSLGDHMKLTWNHNPHNGYFFRAENFFNVASYLDTIGDSYSSYGGKSLHHQSHGESFLALFKNRFGRTGIFILDEPEAALSPMRQLTLLSIIHNLSKKHNAQFIIATHSPMLLAYPHATLYSCDTDELRKIKYTETEHYQITKSFLYNPELYLSNLFSDEE